MRIVIDLPENDEQPGPVLRRRLHTGQVIQVQGFQGTIVGSVVSVDSIRIPGEAFMAVIEPMEAV